MENPFQQQTLSIQAKESLGRTLYKSCLDIAINDYYHNNDYLNRFSHYIADRYKEYGLLLSVKPLKITAPPLNNGLSLFNTITRVGEFHEQLIMDGPEIQYSRIDSLTLLRDIFNGTAIDDFLLSNTSAFEGIVYLDKSRLIKILTAHYPYKSSLPFLFTDFNQQELYDVPVTMGIPIVTKLTRTLNNELVLEFNLKSLDHVYGDIKGSVPIFYNDVKHFLNRIGDIKIEGSRDTYDLLLENTPFCKDLKIFNAQRKDYIPESLLLLSQNTRKEFKYHRNGEPVVGNSFNRIKEVVKLNMSGIQEKTFNYMGNVTSVNYLNVQRSFGNGGTNNIDLHDVIIIRACFHLTYQDEITQEIKTIKTLESRQYESKDLSVRTDTEEGQHTHKERITNELGFIILSKKTGNVLGDINYLKEFNSETDFVNFLETLNNLYCSVYIRTEDDYIVVNMANKFMVFDIEYKMILSIDTQDKPGVLGFEDTTEFEDSYTNYDRKNVKIPPHAVTLKVKDDVTFSMQSIIHNDPSLAQKSPQRDLIMIGIDQGYLYLASSPYGYDTHIQDKRVLNEKVFYKIDLATLDNKSNTLNDYKIASVTIPLVFYESSCVFKVKNGIIVIVSAVAQSINYFGYDDITMHTQYSVVDKQNNELLLPAIWCNERGIIDKVFNILSINTHGDKITANIPNAQSPYYNTSSLSTQPSNTIRGYRKKEKIFIDRFDVLTILSNTKTLEEGYKTYTFNLTPRIPAFHQLLTVKVSDIIDNIINNQEIKSINHDGIRYFIATTRNNMLDNHFLLGSKKSETEVLQETLFRYDENTGQFSIVCNIDNLDFVVDKSTQLIQLEHHAKRSSGYLDLKSVCIMQGS